jgi:electron-transferring-flavoprotein dehydrogenase
MTERQTLDADIVCAGFGPAAGGFLVTLTRGLAGPDGAPKFESRACPGMPLQVIGYERAEGLGFGVSGVVTRARGIRSSFPDFDPSKVPMTAPVTGEKLVYLLDPHGASRRSWALRAGDAVVGRFARDHAFEAPFIPPFMEKHGGFVLSLGQFMQWVGEQVMATGQAQLWPGTPVAAPLIEGTRVTGVRLVDQGTDRKGQPGAGYMPGMDVRAGLTVVADGPYGPVGRALDERFGLPPGHHIREWAVGMKMVVSLPDDTTLRPGTVFHTLGYPEPEIFGFLYVYPDRAASLGIFVPSWYGSPTRTAYRYLQHWMRHPYLWRPLKGATLRSWGAKSLQESGRRGEPFLVGDGYARIGEGSGSTNVLANSGVDEAWTTGVQLAEGVLELLAEKAPFTRENLERAYVKRRRASWVEREGRIAERARDGFAHGLELGLAGAALCGFTGGRLAVLGPSAAPHRRLKGLREYLAGRIPEAELARMEKESAAKSRPLHEAIMDRLGWPPVEFDGKLLVSQQDALLLGGKVQAPPNYADHVVFHDTALCARCEARVCVEMCSGQAISPGEGGVPAFDREKCVHCGACLWNCSKARPGAPEQGNIDFRAGAGGLHSTEN